MTFGKGFQLPVVHLSKCQYFPDKGRINDHSLNASSPLTYLMESKFLTIRYVEIKVFKKFTNNLS